MASINQWIKDLKSKDEVDRAKATIFLMKTMDRRAVEPLIKVLEDTLLVRRGAVIALGLIGDRRAVEPLIKVLKIDDSYQVRLGAAIALGLIGDRRAVEPLKQALQDKDPRVQKAAKLALEEGFGI